MHLNFRVTLGLSLFWQGNREAIATSTQQGPEPQKRPSDRNNGLPDGEGVPSSSSSARGKTAATEHPLGSRAAWMSLSNE